MKERYAVSQIRKQANRLTFGEVKCCTIPGVDKGLHTTAFRKLDVTHQCCVCIYLIAVVLYVVLPYGPH
jgi:hypothetical protein